MEERWITPEEALERSGLDPDTLYKLIADGVVPITYVGAADIMFGANRLQQVADYLAPVNFQDKEGVQIGTAEAASLLGVHRTVVIAWAKKGKLRLLARLRTGQHEIMVDAADVERIRRVIELCGKRQGRSIVPGTGRYRGGLLERLREAEQRKIAEGCQGRQ